jgi:uncharacterized protein YlxW (UPF0749 family)
MWLVIVFCFGLSIVLTLKIRKEIMSVISEYSDRVNAKFALIDEHVDGLVQDVAGLKAKIEQLQNSSGVISAEDQALLDAIENRVGGIADKLQVLDDATVTTPTPDAPTTPTE